MTFEEAVKTAIELEKKVMGAYVRAAKETEDSVGRRVFGLLASEESNHVAYLEKQLASWLDAGRLFAEKVENAIPKKEIIEQEVSKLRPKLKTAASDRELSLLEKAREIEIETSTFYKKAVSDLSDQGRQFFEQFVNIEEGHLALVEAEINSLTGMGFWFDMPEFDLENA